MPEHLTAQNSRVHQLGLTGTSASNQWEHCPAGQRMQVSTSVAVTRWVQPRPMSLDPRWGTRHLLFVSAARATSMPGGPQLTPHRVTASPNLITYCRGSSHDTPRVRRAASARRRTH